MNIEIIYCREKIKDLIALKLKFSKTFILLFLMVTVATWETSVYLQSFGCMIFASFMSFLWIDEVAFFFLRKIK